MKFANKFAAVIGTAALLSSSALFAGDGKSFKEVKPVVEPEATPWWSASLSTGWDSLYMFRGVNTLPNDGNGYGSSLFWTQLSVTFNLTSNDFLTIADWVAFGLTDSSYKENDVIVSYAHTFGKLTLKAGYTFYSLLNANDTGLYSNELNVGASYAIALGPVTITPGLNYYFNVGPNINDGGYVEQTASYLEARIDASAPIYKDIVSLAPYISFGTSFRYNFTEDSSPSPFTGANNLQMGVSLPIAITKNITVAPYGAYSYQWYGLVGTEPSTFWGGGSVTFTF